MLKQSGVNDIGELRQLKEEYEQSQGDLVHDIAWLEDGLAIMKENQEEELKVLQQQKPQDIHVEVGAGPSVDLAAAMQEMRDSYKKMIDANQKDLDDWCRQQAGSS
ncbi:hypothetical protein scyTo_0019647 [Scyliorhinus torazame]|uniref:IF rod domain-containing protein n=1 Tax=Scyliorhinus torazame TaxID=75743 RepID=A0A401Q3R5_SCYTO|nr:hypothetical protein [Scyliorhinus torazame]